MQLSAREVLEQRSSTLASLLEAPGGPFGASSGALGARLAERWRAELRLIARILDETPQGGAVLGTLDIWHARTTTFMAGSDRAEPEWTDRQGILWRSGEVIEILDDLRDRLASWRVPEDAVLTRTDAPAPGAADGPGASPSAATSPAEQPRVEARSPRGSRP